VLVAIRCVVVQRWWSKVIGVSIIGFHSYYKQFDLCSGSYSCFGKNLELQLLFDSCSASWNGLFKPQRPWFIHEIELQIRLLIQFFENIIATLNPLRPRLKTLNTGFDHSPTTITVKIFGSPFWVSRVYSLKIWVVVTKIFEAWVSRTQFI